MKKVTIELSQKLTFEIIAELPDEEVEELEEAMREDDVDTITDILENDFNPEEPTFVDDFEIETFDVENINGGGNGSVH